MLNNFQLIFTKDGSPTLKPVDSEAMHSYEGALSESLAIYGTAIDLAFKHQWTPSFLSVGLGLGYNEWILVAKALYQNQKLSSFYIESYESLPALKESFLKVLHHEGPDQEENPFFLAFQKVAQSFQISPFHLRQTLLSLYQNKQFCIRGALTEKTSWSSKFSVILFDAYSSQTSPDLWSETFLVNFLKHAAAPCCILATYASTGNLKRALLQEGFTLIPKKGFGKKRESTLAVRGLESL